MINARIDTARHVLILTASNEGRAELAEAYARGGYRYAEGFVAEGLHEAYEFVPPENVPGALTDAPILVDCDYLEYPDNGERIIRDGAAVYWFPDYMVTDPFEVLKNTGRVEFPEAQPYASDTPRPRPESPEFIRSHFPGGERQGVAIWIGDHSFPEGWTPADITAEYPELSRNDHDPDLFDSGLYFWDGKGHRHGPYNGGATGCIDLEKAGGCFKERDPDAWEDPRQPAMI